MNPFSRFACASMFVVMLGAMGAGAPAEEVSGRSVETRNNAVALYDEGRYAEALPLLAAIDAAGAADGPLLYRLSYCQRVAGKDDEADKTQGRAKIALESELAAAKTLETSFYLVNTYQNLGSTADVRRVAKETIARLEASELPAPETKLQMFQLGKLYADQGDEDKAAEWYARSLDQSTDGAPGSSYVRWAARFLAERAFRAGAYSDADTYFTMLDADSDLTAADYDRLALARARTGRFAEAAAAWERVVLLNPADANRGRYLGQLAKMAGQLGGLPAESPAGGPWSALDKAELERLLGEQAEIANQILAEVKATTTSEERAELRARLGEVKPVFVAAALEYGLRGYSIRELAFFGGYAPLILKRGAWRIRK